MSRAIELLKQSMRHPLAVKAAGRSFTEEELATLDGLPPDERVDVAAFALGNAAPALANGVAPEYRTEARQLFAMYCEAYLAALKELGAP